MFRRLPPQGGTLREVSEVVNGVLNGKTNNTGTVTLAVAGATSTVINDERISPDSKIILIPFSAAANDDTAPFAQFLCTAGQTAAAADTDYEIGLNTTVYASGVVLQNTSEVKVLNDGVYNFQFSIQFENQDNVQHDANVWFRKNGVDITNSNSIFTVPARKSATVFGKAIGTVNIFVDLEADDYIEMVWSTENVLLIIKTVGTQTSPTRPATPCVILTVNYVAPQAYSNIFVISQTYGQATVSHWANSVADKTYAYVVIG
jgi:hypothetical protein